VIYLVLPVLVP